MRSQQWSGIFKNINVIVLKKRSTGIKQNSGCIFGKYNESLAFANKISTVKYWQTVRIFYLFGTMGMMRHVSCVCVGGGGGGESGRRLLFWGGDTVERSWPSLFTTCTSVCNLLHSLKIDISYLVVILIRKKDRYLK